MEVYLGPRDSFPLFDPPRGRTVSIGGNGVQLCAENLDRVVLLIACAGTAPLFLGLDSDVAVNQGIQLAVGGLPLILSHQTHGPLTQLAWYCSQPTAGSMAYVVEVILARPPTGVRPAADRYPPLRWDQGADD